MGQIKNIKLHIVTDIKTKMLQSCLQRLQPHLTTALRATITARTTTKTTILTPQGDNNTPPQLHNYNQTTNYSTDSKGYPTTCPGANYLKEGDDVVLKHPSEYPDWLWTLAEQDPYKLTDVDPVVHGQRKYEKRWRRAYLRKMNRMKKSGKWTKEMGKMPITDIV